MPNPIRPTVNNFNYNYHFFAGAMMGVLSILAMTLGLSSLPVVDTFSFKLSRLLYEEYSDEGDMNRKRPAFPRRDLEEEYGEEALECLIDSALGLVVDGEVCLNHDPKANADTGTEQNSAGAMNAPSASYSASQSPASARNSYGVDVSFPIHSADLDAFPHQSDGSALLHDRNQFYGNFIKGCRDYYGQASARSSSHGSVCDDSETDRYDMNLNQPPVMQNYTTLGFQKTKAPKHIMEELKQFWEENSNILRENKQQQFQHSLQQESWYPGDTHTNHWENKTYILNVEDSHLMGGGMGLKHRIWKAAESTLLQWMQTEVDASNLKPSEKAKGKAEKLKLTPASLYGIRMYTEGAVLAPHVDRLPLVTSAIINVAQDVEEPWPLEVYAHDGNAYNVTLEPGDMLLYESHSVIHGRPFPLKGNYYANVFIHFEPENHCVRHAERMQGVELAEDVEEMYKRAERKQAALRISARSQHDKTYSNGDIQGKISATELPFFIQPNSYQSKRWKQEIGYKRDIKDLRHAPPPSLANVLASKGDIQELKKLAATHPGILLKADNNGWQPVHEAARSGNTKVLEYLIENGVDINARTNFGKGGNAVWWSEEQNGLDHPSTKLLKKAGGVRIAPQAAV